VLRNFRHERNQRSGDIFRFADTGFLLARCIEIQHLSCTAVELSTTTSVFFLDQSVRDVTSGLTLWYHLGSDAINQSTNQSINQSKIHL
jgi:hypothetical protein